MIPEAKPINSYTFELAATVVVNIKATSIDEARLLAKERTKGGAFLGTLSPDGAIVLAVEGGRVYLSAVNGRPV